MIGKKDLLRPAVDEIIDLGHPLARLSGEIDWGFLDRRFASVCQAGPGQPGLPTRLVAGLFILKHMHNLSDEALCARWLENPYYQFFCGELSFCHKLPFDRSSLTRWRQRLGEEQLVALIQESLSVAHKTGAIETRDLERVVMDTTVQPKAIAHPTDARLMHRALEKLVRLARQGGVPLRQSYVRVAKRAAIMIGRYTHAHQFKRMRRELKFLRIRLWPGDPRYPPQDCRTSGPSGALQLAARSRNQGQHSGSPPTRPEDLFAARPRSRVHRQRKGPRTLRVRLQSERRNAGHVTEGRPVRAACQGAARQSFRWPHPWTDGRRLGEAHRRPGAPHPRRQRLSRPQREQAPASGSAARSVVPPRPYGAR